MQFFCEHFLCQPIGNPKTVEPISENVFDVVFAVLHDYRTLPSVTDLILQNHTINSYDVHGK